MPTLTNPYRPPAETPKKGLFGRLLNAAVASRFWPTAVCLHRETGLPFNNRQRCLECGAVRAYIFFSDFEHADAGIQVGPWHKIVTPHQNAHRVVAKHLIEGAIANCPHTAESIVTDLQPVPDSLRRFIDEETAVR